MLVTRIWSNRIVFGLWQADFKRKYCIFIEKWLFQKTSEFRKKFLSIRIFLMLFCWTISMNSTFKLNCYLNLNKNYALVWNLNFFPPKSSFLWDMPDLHKVWCSNHWRLGRLAFGSDFLNARLTDWRILSRFKKCKSDSLETSGRWRRCLPQF